MPYANLFYEYLFNYVSQRTRTRIEESRYLTHFLPLSLANCSCCCRALALLGGYCCPKPRTPLADFSRCCLDQGVGEYQTVVVLSHWINTSPALVSPLPLIITPNVSTEASTQAVLQLDPRERRTWNICLEP